MSWLETELREQPAALEALLERESGYTIYEQPPRLDGAVVVGISQSGASPDVASVLAEGRRQGRPTIALTNDPASPLAQQADAVLPLDAGEERAVAATKTYLNSLGAIALLFTAIGEDPVALAELRAMPALLEQQIALSFDTAPPLDEYRDAVGATVVARGVNYCTAFEIALKIRELPLKERRARVIAVSDVDAVLRRAQTKLPLVPRVPEWLSPMTAVIPGQLTAMRLAQLRGLDIDSPRGLRKVTLTR